MPPSSCAVLMHTPIQLCYIQPASVRVQRKSPEPPLQGFCILQKRRLQPEVLPKHAVQQAPVQVPLQGLSQHELLAQPKAGCAHMQRQHPLVQHPYQVVLLAHDA